MYNMEAEDEVLSRQLWTILDGNGYKGMDFLRLNAKQVEFSFRPYTHIQTFKDHNMLTLK